MFWLFLSCRRCSQSRRPSAEWRLRARWSWRSCWHFGRWAVQQETSSDGQRFTDNWSGIVAWENADRFAGSPANTSTGVATLVNPSVATVKACATKSKIKKQPYFDDCRWKTQNVIIDGNAFAIDPSKVHGCKPSKGCGFNGVFSNYGSYPRWSPYQGKSCKRTSRSSRTTCGGTTPTSGTALHGEGSGARCHLGCVAISAPRSGRWQQ